MAAIFSLLFQGIAWAGMVTANPLTDAEARVYSGHEAAIPCHTAEEDDARIQHADDVQMAHADDHCASDCVCASFCSGMLGASLDAQTHPAAPGAAVAAFAAAHAARQPENPFRPPIPDLL
jgi:hypothetical protein